MSTLNQEAVVSLWSPGIGTRMSVFMTYESVRTKVRTRMSVREDVFMGWEKEERLLSSTHECS